MVNYYFHAQLLVVAWIVHCFGKELHMKRVFSKGLLVVPGLGRADRLKTVINNINIIRSDYAVSYGLKWDCIVYIYAPRELDSFWSQTEAISYLQRECRVVEVPNQKVTENLYMVQPALIEQYYMKVFIVLDDCKIQDAATFNLTHILQVMDVNKLTVASPMVR